MFRNSAITGKSVLDALNVIVGWMQKLLRVFGKMSLLVCIIFDLAERPKLLAKAQGNINAW